MMKRLLNISLLLAFVLSGCYSGASQDGFSKPAQTESDFAETYFEDSGFKPVPAPPEEPEAAAAEEAERVAAEKPVAKVPEVARSGGSALIAVGQAGSYVASTTYPCADYGIVQLDKIMPKEVVIGQRFDYSIKVTNLTDVTLIDVLIAEELPQAFGFVGATPTAEIHEQRLVWRVDSLGPRASKEFTVYGSADEVDILEHQTSMTHTMRAAANIKVVQPQLALIKVAPAEVLLCDPISVEFVVTNLGTGFARNVRVVDSLSAGLQTLDGKSELVLDAGTLAAGESRQFSAQLRAMKAGTFASKALGVSASGLKVESDETVTAVRQPILTITKTGPARKYIGGSLAYEITVTNTGDGPARDTIVEDTVPAGVASVEATAGARLSGPKLVWDFGTLAPGASKSARVSYVPTEAGELMSTASASGYCAERVAASVRTSVIGSAAVRLEVIDVDDPVEVGGQTTYLITAANQGSAPDTNIRVVCTLEDKLRYVASAGATAGSIMGNTVSFAPLASLSPKAKATWRVVVRGVRAGDVRFRVVLNSDQLARPVEETVATRLYE
ncbi:MAG: DUF11 domain-containing protein [Phycisphaerales bacterium]|nr:MAG: DUF11 domain-containing protein [Phycisphaerales bacterium]